MRRAAVGGEMYGEGRAGCGHHTLGKAAHYVEPLLADVHQPQFVQGEGRHPGQKSVDQFRRVAGTPTDYSNFHDSILRLLAHSNVSLLSYQ
jgi:hypothetical protein